MRNHSWLLSLSTRRVDSASPQTWGRRQSPHPCKKSFMTSATNGWSSTISTDFTFAPDDARRFDHGRSPCDCNVSWKSVNSNRERIASLASPECKGFDSDEDCPGRLGIEAGAARGHHLPTFVGRPRGDRHERSWLGGHPLRLHCQSKRGVVPPAQTCKVAESDLRFSSNPRDFNLAPSARGRAWSAQIVKKCTFRPARSRGRMTSNMVPRSELA